VELIFIRHGQGEHTVNLPESLGMINPSLTTVGRIQAIGLRTALPLTSDDALIVSPTLRTLQTASIWSGSIDCCKVVHPLVAPRIFPARVAATTLPCDELRSLEKLRDEFPSFDPASNLPSSLWSTGINVISDLQRERIYIVTHDGTITSYRQKISDQPLTRDDFLEETEWVQLVVEE